jgi:dTDP-4-amino-4,6-dideoxygalactose transaminase
MQMLSPLADELRLELPIVPPDREQAYHMFYVLLADRATRDAALESMRAQGVQPTFHYVPLHSAPAAERFAVRRTECPVTDDVSDRLLRLPFHNNLAIDDIARVVSSLCNALARIGAE